MDFLIGGTAAMCAGVFSNPFDVIKTRQQLQGELQKNTKSKLPYRGLGQAITTIVKAEGLKGLQKGLGSALGFQFVMNSTRLGLYETVDQLGWTLYSETKDHSPVRCVLWGAYLYSQKLRFCELFFYIFRRNSWYSRFSYWMSFLYDQNTDTGPVTWTICCRIST